MTSNAPGNTTRTNHACVALPAESVLVAPAPPRAVPLRPPDGMWGLVVVAVRTTDTTDLLAGVWLPAPPPAALHTGDVVVRLLAPADDDLAVADVEVVAATQGGWTTVRTWQAVGTRWPHEVAMSALVHMRYLADVAFKDAQWATLTGPIAAALPPGLLTAGLVGESAAASPAPRAHPDALAELIEAGLVEVGEQLVWNGHTATVRQGGVLHDGGPHEFAVSTVTALATSLAGSTVNGWHLWRRARDDRPLSDLRTALATR